MSLWTPWRPSLLWLAVGLSLSIQIEKESCTRSNYAFINLVFSSPTFLDFYSDSDTDGDPLSPTAAAGKVPATAKSDHRVTSNSSGRGLETRTVASSSAGTAMTAIPATAGRSPLSLPPPPALM